MTLRSVWTMLFLIGCDGELEAEPETPLAGLCDPVSAVECVDTEDPNVLWCSGPSDCSTLPTTIVCHTRVRCERELTLDDLNAAAPAIFEVTLDGPRNEYLCRWPMDDDSDAR